MPHRTNARGLLRPVVIMLVGLLVACTAPPAAERNAGGLPAAQPAIAQTQTIARPVTPGIDDEIGIRGMNLRLPRAPGWTRREIGMANGGRLYELERNLPGGNRGQVHVVDYFPPIRALGFELFASGANDAIRLNLYLAMVEDGIFGQAGVHESRWADLPREVMRRHRTVCRERHEERADADPGYKWRDWMLFCMDPVAHLPVEVDYAERYPVAAGGPRPDFPRDAAAVFDAIRFSRTDAAARPVAELPAALIQANNRLFSNDDDRDYPAAVVVSLDPTYPVDRLQALGRRLFQLKGTRPSQPLQARIAADLTEEIAHFAVFLPIPVELAGADNVFKGSIVIRRSLLPARRIGSGSGADRFVLRVRVAPTGEYTYGLEHVGIQPVP